MPTPNPTPPPKGAPRRPTALCAVSQSVLPGEQTVDERFLDQAVADLNQIYTAKALETARLIGQYTLETFFGNSLDQFHDRGKKHLSFRRLAEHPDLRFSSSYLWTCVAVVEQFQHLPLNLAEALPLSHHRLLLPIRDPEEKIKLATAAIERGLSKREFAEAIRPQSAPSRSTRSNRNSQNPGDHPLAPGDHPLARALTQIRTAVTDALSSPGLDDLTGMPPTTADDFLEDLEREVGKLTQLLNTLRRRGASTRRASSSR